MLKVIIKVLLSLLSLAYAAAFLFWNSASQDIVTWNLRVKLSQALPVGALAFIGVVIGAAVMAISALSAYGTQKAAATKAVATVKKAKEKLQAQLDAINELRAEVERLEGELSSLQAGDGSWGRVNVGEAGAATDAGAQAAPSATHSETDDDEVI
jgi:hypothetical protein